MKVICSPKDVYSLTYASIFTKIIMRSKMRNDPHIFPTATCCKNQLLKPQGCLNQMFEEENLIQSGHEQYLMRLWIN